MALPGMMPFTLHRRSICFIFQGKKKSHSVWGNSEALSGKGCKQMVKKWWRWDKERGGSWASAIASTKITCIFLFFHMEGKWLLHRTYLFNQEGGKKPCGTSSSSLVCERSSRKPWLVLRRSHQSTLGDVFLSLMSLSPALHSTSCHLHIPFYPHLMSSLARQHLRIQEREMKGTIRKGKAVSLPSRERVKVGLPLNQTTLLFLNQEMKWERIEPGPGPLFWKTCCCSPHAAETSAVPSTQL